LSQRTKKSACEKRKKQHRNKKTRLYNQLDFIIDRDLEGKGCKTEIRKIKLSNFTKSNIKSYDTGHLKKKNPNVFGSRR
jgi:hypothetical protein